MKMTIYGDNYEPPAPLLLRREQITDKLAPDLERDGGGIESKARNYTNLMGILHEEGIVDRKIVIPRSKLESAIKRDGKRKLQELASRTPLGLWVLSFQYGIHP